jgi:hypothetical protein
MLLTGPLKVWEIVKVYEMGNLDVLLNRLFNQPNSLAVADELTLLFEKIEGGGEDFQVHNLGVKMLN